MSAIDAQVGKCGRHSFSGDAVCGSLGYVCPTCRVILAQREIDERTCSFSQTGFYAGDVVCPTDDLSPMTLTVVATGTNVNLLLCRPRLEQLFTLGRAT